jgi:hypothetical protein
MLLTIIRTLLDIEPQTDEEIQDFMLDGWPEVRIRIDHAFSCILQGPTASMRRQNYKDRPHIKVLEDGSLWELTQYCFSPQGMIKRFDNRAWRANWAMAHTEDFVPNRKAIAFLAVTPT